VLREANRDDRFGDLCGKLKADVKVTTQTRKRSAADAVRTLPFTGVKILPEARFTCPAQKSPAALAGSVGQPATCQGYRNIDPDISPNAREPSRNVRQTILTREAATTGASRLR
jgi:hypothetical protein